MPTINGKACVVDGKPVDKVYSNGKIVYGRNLILETNNNISQTSDWFKWVANVSSQFIKAGRSICLSLLINNSPYSQILGKGNAYLQAQPKDISGNMLVYANGNPIDFTSDGISQVSFVIPDKTDSILLFAVTNNMNQNTYCGCPKAEFGTSATPWSPAPEDVM